MGKAMPQNATVCEWSPVRSIINKTALACFLGVAGLASAKAADMPNSCPVDGCIVTISAVDRDGDELRVTLASNFTPDNSRNHFHMWWGEQYDVRQVGRNASSEHSVEQGKWHRHDDYPLYLTTGAASTTVREGATTLCVTAADRDHNVLDAALFDCMDVSQQLN
ncbi:MAG: hypothetical protein AAGA11_08350 [Pseudomonadota bacterium]